jgi:hypothetical protein
LFPHLKSNRRCAVLSINEMLTYAMKAISHDKGKRQQTSAEANL